eukprot:6182053-Pleurochrysis_carterae.AAC.1
MPSKIYDKSQDLPASESAIVANRRVLGISLQLKCSINISSCSYIEDWLQFAQGQVPDIGKSADAYFVSLSQGISEEHLEY